MFLGQFFKKKNATSGLHAPRHFFNNIGNLIIMKHKLVSAKAYLTEEVPQPLSDWSKMHYKA